LAELGSRAAQARQLPEAIAYLRKSVELDPSQPRVLYQLSLAYALSRDLPNARAAALSLARIAPSYPGLADLLATLGLRR
jgi:Flp pilus assembly protein TadD